MFNIQNDRFNQKKYKGNNRIMCFDHLLCFVENITSSYFGLHHKKNTWSYNNRYFSSKYPKKIKQ